MNNKILLGSTLAFAMIASSTAMSGGFSRGGVDYSVLFSDKKVDSEVGFTFVAPQRTIDSSTRAVNLTGGPSLTSTDIDVDGSYFVPKVAAKVGFGEHVDCAATFSTPFGADQDNGLNTAVSGSAVEFEIDTEDYGLTCSFKYNLGQTKLGESRIRLIGGGSYLRFDGFLSRQSFVDFVGIPAAFIPPGLGALNAEGLGLFNIDDEAFGWRAGLAYEIPKSAIRVSAVYSSAYDINATGTVDISGFNTPAALAVPTAPISLTTELPQQVDINVQSGINEKTLAFARFNWTDWSQLGSIPVEGVLSPLTATPTDTFFEPLYRDGLTLTGGVGRKFTEGLSGQLSLTWDRGTSTTTGTQSDTWLISTGLSFKANENVSIQAGGAVGILTSGFTSGVGVLDVNTQASRSFGNDFVGAFSASAKISF